MPQPRISEAVLREALALQEKYGNSFAVEAATGINATTHRCRLLKARAHFRHKELSARGAKMVPGMEAVEVTDQLDADGALKGFSVKQRAATTEALANPDKAIPGFALKRISTLYGRENEKLLEWQIQSPDDVARFDAAKAFIEGLASAIPPGPLVAAPDHCDEDLLSLYPLGDPHFGMRAHAPEAGENFDLKIAEQITKAAIDRLVASAPPSATAILCNLGDFFHADDNSARTRQSGNPLDVDGRWHEVLKIGAWTMAHLVNRLLAKHARVIVYNERGNHDDISALVLSVSLSMHFADNPRVKIETSPAYFHFYEHGAVLLGFTHGDGPKEGDLPGIMANDEPAAWGRTKFRVWHRGHFHHDMVKDLTGAGVETHRTLAGSDAWHRKSGYRAQRDAKRIDYHRQFGEVERVRVNIDMLKAA
jgi:hypothetical protein